MVEEWRDIPDYPGYQVSNNGKVRSFWHQRKRSGTWGGKKRVLTETPYELRQSDDGNGYLKVYLQNDEKRKCAKVHRLVAESFISREDGKDTVDHIKSGDEGKKDNSINNLRWLSRRDNIQKAYADGMCDQRIKRSMKPVVVYDSWSGDEAYFDSIKEVSDVLHVDHSTLSHAIARGCRVRRRYYIGLAGREDILLFGLEGYDDELGYY